MSRLGGVLVTVLSIDPGKRIGYALFTDEGEDIERGVIQFDDWFVTGDGPVQLWGVATGVRLRFEDRGVTQLVVEGFRHDPLVQQGGSLHWASQVEGAVKMLAALTGTPIAVQYAGTALPVAKLFTGYVDPTTKTGNKKHLPDEDSAWLHGMYWLRSQGIV